MGAWAKLSLLSHVAVVAALAAPARAETALIDEDPIPSPRAQAMGGALATVADDVDALFHNPAGIGGLGDQKSKNDSWVHKLYFPAVSLGANSNSVGLAKDLKSSGATSDATIGSAVVDADVGKREYGRANAVGGLVLGRLALIGFKDQQIAMTPNGDGTLDTTSREMSGLAYGFSMQDDTGHLSLGYSGYTATRTQTHGDFAYTDIDHPLVKDAAIKAATQTSSGQASNAGAVYKFGKTGVTAFGLNVKNVGNTVFKGSGETLTVKQDVDAAFSVAPKLGKQGILTFIVEMDRLTDADVSLAKKYHLGAELGLGGIGSYGVFALRTGYNSAGASGGLMLNVGLIGLEASTYAVDLATDNSRLVERRQALTVYVNVADF